MIAVRLRNYRCFVEESDAEIQVAPGFTALVGPNNSGKTAFLRAFYELRPVLAQLADPKTIEALVPKPSGLSTNPVGVRDLEELQPLYNSLPKSVTFNLGLPSHRPVLVDLNGARTFVAGIRQGPERDGVQQHHGELLHLPDGTQQDVRKLAYQFRVLSDAAYFGPFRSIVGESQSSYYDLEIGRNFVTLWNEWKTGDQLAQNRAVQRACEAIAAVFGFQQLEISSAHGGTELQVTIDGQPYRLRELGAGLTHFIIVICSLAVQPRSLVLIDEPEMNLHPSLQADFLTLVGRYATDGVVFATHSVGLARSIADRVYTFRMSDRGSRMARLEHMSSLSEFLGEMSYSGYSSLGYKTVLLVEGVTDVKVVRQFLRQLRTDHMVVVIPLGGDDLAVGNRAEELAELTRLSPDVFALVDSERTAPGGPPAVRRQGFLETCAGLGIRAHLTGRRAIENYLSDAAVKAVFGIEYSALGPYEKLADAAKVWPKRENWRAAGAMQPEELHDVGDFLKQVVVAAMGEEP